ncbi:MAG: tetratricopeptide repeat protein [Candidatus Latescibacterota bacterium]|nr:tetratricopeptide repeat protein [Candidatus Latescibacterota bacterium]
MPLANEVGAKRRGYLAMIGPVAMVATAVHALCQRFDIPRGYYALVTLVLACSLGYRTIDRNRDYANAVAIWQATVQTAPHNPRAHNNLGFALAEEGQNEAAINHYRQALAINPEYPDAHYNLGNAYTSFENWNEAVNHYRKMLSKENGYAPAHINLGNALKA